LRGDANPRLTTRHPEGWRDSAGKPIELPSRIAALIKADRDLEVERERTGAKAAPTHTRSKAPLQAEPMSAEEREYRREFIGFVMQLAPGSTVGDEGPLTVKVREDDPAPLYDENGIKLPLLRRETA